MQGIKKWLAANPHRESELLHQNPSMIFFRERPAGVAPAGRAGGDGGDGGVGGDDGHDGPIGSLGVPISAGRSIALDPRYVRLGLPVFLSTQLPTGPTRRLVMAQDTGSAIVGPHRADFFFGSGLQAGEVAGRMKAQGEMVVLLPR
jgi:Membrane-bound lytic murein transglycosylase